MNTDSTLAPSRATFDPAQWLARFAEVGGIYSLTPDGGLYIGWVNPDHTSDDQRTAAAMKAGLTLEQHEALKACLAGEAQGPDFAIQQAWQRWSDAFERYNRLPFSEQPGGAYTPEEAAEWAIIDAAEKVMRSTIATTPAGVAAQLWTVLNHMVTNKDQEEATRRRDLAAFDKIDREMDWSERMILAALRSLHAMEA